MGAGTPLLRVSMCSLSSVKLPCVGDALNPFIRGHLTSLLDMDTQVRNMAATTCRRASEMMIYFPVAAAAPLGFTLNSTRLMGSETRCWSPWLLSNWQLRPTLPGSLTVIKNLLSFSKTQNAMIDQSPFLLCWAAVTPGAQPVLLSMSSCS